MTTTPTSQPTDTDIAITAAAERIAEIAAHYIRFTSAADEDELATACAAIRADVQRIAVDELRRRTDDAYALGVQHAMPSPSDPLSAWKDWQDGYQRGYAMGCKHGGAPAPTAELDTTAQDAVLMEIRDGINRIATAISNRAS